VKGKKRKDKRGWAIPSKKLCVSCKVGESRGGSPNQARKNIGEKKAPIGTVFERNRKKTSKNGPSSKDVIGRVR